MGITWLVTKGCDGQGRLRVVSQKAKWRGRCLSVFALGKFLTYPLMPLADESLAVYFVTNIKEEDKVIII